jgi:hypothetical protein
VIITQPFLIPRDPLAGVISWVSVSSIMCTAEAWRRLRAARACGFRPSGAARPYKDAPQCNLTVGVSLTRSIAPHVNCRRPAIVSVRTATPHYASRICQDDVPGEPRTAPARVWVPPALLSGSSSDACPVKNLLRRSPKLAQVCQERVDRVSPLFWLLAHPPMPRPLQYGHRCAGALCGTSRECLTANKGIISCDNR